MGPDLRAAARLATLVGGRAALAADVLDGLGEQRVQGLSLGWRERRQYLVVERVQRLVEVGAHAAALDQPGVVESVQDRHEVRGVDADQLGQRLLSGWPALAQVLEREQLPRAQADRRDS